MALAALTVVSATSHIRYYATTFKPNPHENLQPWMQCLCSLRWSLPPVVTDLSCIISILVDISLLMMKSKPQLPDYVLYSASALIVIIVFHSITLLTSNNRLAAE